MGMANGDDLPSAAQPVIGTELDKLAFAARFASELFAYINSNHQIDLANKAFWREFCPEYANINQIAVSEVFADDAFLHLFTDNLNSCFGGQQGYTEYSGAGKRGFDKNYGVQFIPYYVDDSIVSALVLFRDISYIRRLEKRLQLLEYKDRRTGLPNRRSFDLVLNKELASASRTSEGNVRAILFISLENFARINQTYGYEVGDILLENSGIRIRDTIISELLRDSDYVFATEPESESESEVTPVPIQDPSPDAAKNNDSQVVFRFEGKEFMAILTDIARATDAAIVAMRIAKNVSMPYRDKFGAEIFVKCAIGIAIYPTDGEEKDLLIQHAVSAMHEAKRLGVEFQLFNKTLHQRALEKMRLGGSIYTAFLESQFELHFQPVVDYDGNIVGAEALIRWNHPERGIIGPGEFVPLAVEKGIIVNIGKWVLYSVLKYLEGWPKDIYISLNLSVVEFEQTQVVENIVRALKNAARVEASQLKIEITETDSMVDPKDSIRKMKLLSDSGIDIMIDDFGTGHSSLHYLKDLPARTLKIDRSFVMDIDNDGEESMFLESIVELAHSRKKTVVIEGVENKKQLDLIRKMKPAYLQGYYFSGPIPSKDFEQMLFKRSRLPIS